MAELKYIGIKVKEEEKIIIEKLAELKGISVSELIRSKFNLIENDDIQHKILKMNQRIDELKNDLATEKKVSIEIAKSVFYVRYTVRVILTMLSESLKNILPNDFININNEGVNKYINEKLSDIGQINDGGKHGIQ